MLDHDISSEIQDIRDRVQDIQSDLDPKVKALVLAAYASGRSPNLISQRFGISIEDVNQILEEALKPCNIA